MRTGRLPIRLRSLLLLIVAGVLFASLAGAQIQKQSSDLLSSLTFTDDKLAVSEPIEAFEDVQGLLPPGLQNGWAAFRLGANANWTAAVDKRSGQIAMAEGGNIAWLPGRGNSLRTEDIADLLGGKPEPDLSVLDSIARKYLSRVSSLLGIEAATLALDLGRSGQPASHVWLVDYNVVREGLPIEGARVVFRVNNGNLIQFGTEYLPSPGAAVPKTRLTAAQALEVVSKYIGGIDPAGDKFLDEGSLHLLPANVKQAGSAEGFAFGKGRGLVKVWQLTFRRDGVLGTWQARVDASTGELLEFQDVNQYGQATGGVYTHSPAVAPEVLRAMPYADVAPGVFASSAGVFGSATSSALNGQFVRILDDCGTISLTPDSAGNLSFGTSGGTDCATPGIGGPGNTHSSRTQFYHVNRIKEVARGWLPTNPWLQGKLTVNVNINQSCNANWNGSSINFFKSGGGCNNTGEIAGVSLHEFGHGLDSNDGSGAAPDGGTREAYGDVTAALQLHTSCMGPGFRATNCTGYGDACTSCTGVRDIDFAKHASNTPATVSNFTQVRCDPGTGPCGRNIHCESHVASQAIWDLANRDLPNPGTSSAWSVTERLWYSSRSTATSAFSCNTAGTFTSNGCGVGSWWKTMRAVDDDDGNLANGTPRSCNLFAAFNRHGIACATDAGANTCFAGCAAPSAPAMTVTPRMGSVTVVVSGTGVKDIYRNDLGCNYGFIKIADNFTGTSFTDTGVADGTTYYYQAVAHASGNEACSSAPATCRSATPQRCVPNSTTLCLQGNRFKAQLTWKNGGVSNPGSVLTYSNEGGFFHFGNASNPEVGVKILDGRPVNGRFWVFHGALTSLEYTLTVTDMSNGVVKTYTKAAGSMCGGTDAGTFALAASGSPGKLAVPLDAEPVITPKAVCTPTSTSVCLLGNRFRVEVKRGGVAQPAVALTSLSGAFWFFNSTNPEVAVKVLDGTPVNGRYWVFFAPLTDQSYQVVVTDTNTGAVKTYNSPPPYCGIADTSAF